jgi:2-polyprenyl-6-methoxyphenol hydroxylase-like FAD-dependent oxidoreductase
MRVVVLGAGVAGCAAALAHTRDGNAVVVLDRDPGPVATDPDVVFETWSAYGVPQHRQPHNFLGLGRAVLRDRFPDRFGELLAAGADEVDLSLFLGDAPRVPGDEDLATIACRRPVFDAALRRAVEVRAAEATGLVTREGRVTAVALADGTVEAELVVDAGGRASRVPDWLAAEGLPQPPPQQSDCGLLYYSRHYRLRDGLAMPPYASPLGGPRGDLGYLAFAVFLGDRDTFCLCVMVPPSDRPFRDLRDTASFERVARLLPGMEPWLEVAEPITEVLPMGHLHNTFRPPGDAVGVLALGDARCHTNPTFAYGASMGLAHGALLADLVRKAGDVAELGALFAAEVDPDLRARFDAVTAEDRDRARIWGGEPVDVTDPAATMPFFLRSVVFRVAPKDPAILRAAGRRMHALDPVDQLESESELMTRSRRLFEEIRGSIPAPPPREQLLAALSG